MGEKNLKFAWKLYAIIYDSLIFKSIFLLAFIQQAA